MARQYRIYSRPKQPTQARRIRRTNRSQNRQNRPKTHYLSHLKKDPIPCPRCRELNTSQTLAGYSSLSHHYESQHPECSIPVQILIQKDDQLTTHVKSKRGKPKKKSTKKRKTQKELMQEDSDWKTHQTNAYFMADVLKCFEQALEEQQEKITKLLPAKQYAIEDPKLSPAKMIQRIDQIVPTLKKKWESEKTQDFVALCMFCVRKFLQRLKQNQYPSEDFPFKQSLNIKEESQILALISMTDENDLEELIELQGQENFFGSIEEWKAFSDKFNEEFLSRMKKDLLTIIWLSGTISKNLFVEYFYLIGSVMDKESRFSKFLKKGTNMAEEIGEQQQENELVRFVENDQGFMLLSLSYRLELINLRKIFLQDV